MLTCKHASQLVSQSLDRRLTIRERFMLRLHLLVCNACSRFFMQLTLLSKMIHRMKKQAEEDTTIKLNPEAKQRITEAIDNKTK